MLTDSNAPIAAIATAPGRGGIGVIRVSGAGLSPVIRALLGESGAARLQPRAALYGAFLAADGGEIDRGLALYFPAPHSYTGEDVLELQAHGGPVVLQLLLARCLQAGAAAAPATGAPPAPRLRLAQLRGELPADWLTRLMALAADETASTPAVLRARLHELVPEYAPR